MRVAVIIQNFSPFIGGAEKQALEQSAALIERGTPVQVLTRARNGSPSHEKIRGVPVLRLPCVGSGVLNALSFSFSLALHLIFNRDRYDVYHVHLASSHSIPAAALGRLFHKKVVIKLGGGYQIGELALSRRSELGRLKLRLLAWARPRFIAVNEGQREELTASGLDASSVELIPNGVNLKTFRPPSPAEKKSLREKLRWEGTVFLFVGRFAADKLRLDIFDRFIEAWSRSSGKSQAISFYMVGQGPLQREYERSIARFGVEESVEIVGPSDNVAALYQAADVFVLPSISEGLSNSLLEAMACGLPVLGSRVPGIVDVVSDETHGFLFDPMSANDIDRALRRALQDPRRLAEMAKRCIKDVQPYSVEDTVGRIAALYEGPVPRP